MDLGMWLLLSVVCCLIVYVPSSKYIKAWLNKRRRLSRMNEVTRCVVRFGIRIWRVC